MSKNLKIAVADTETDPAEYEVDIKPFAVGLYLETGEYQQFWGINCIEKFLEFTTKHCRDYKVYFHNGGKFDFNFLLKYVGEELVKLINGRLVQMHIDGVLFVDSIPLMPFPLDEYKKTKIDYNKFRANNREKHKKEISRYLFDDCRYLFELLTGFLDKVGNHMTIGTASFNMMRSLGIDIPRCGETHDIRFRPYYFGGRCQAFKKGILENITGYYYDINKSYQHSMLFDHPTGKDYEFYKELPDKQPYFAHIVAKSAGALPIRIKKQIQFPVTSTPIEFFATGWEIEAGLETGTLDIHRVLGAFVPRKTINFSPFVQHCTEERNIAKQSGDKATELAFKYLGNSGYGKLSTNPRKFKDYCFVEIGEYVEEPWEPEYDVPHAGVTLWSRPSANRESAYYDVAAGASICGHARAKLWRAIAGCARPLYCDTDSILSLDKCTHLDLGPEVGQWELEAEFDYYACYGKKGYACRTANGWKTASKGVRLEPEEIIRAAKGDVVTYFNPFPTFRQGKQTWIKRNISIT